METTFEIATKVAVSGWVALAAALMLPHQRPALFAYAGRILPVLLAATYAVMLAIFFSDMPALHHDPSSVAGVRELWSADAGLLGAWLHFLALDLLFGAWMTADGLERGIPRAALLAVMVLTWWAGPLGAAFYLALRLVARRSRPA